MSSNEQIFNSYEEAHRYSLTIPWKIEIPDGSVDKETAEYVVELHNRSVNLYQSQKKRLQALQKLNDYDQELGFE